MSWEASTVGGSTVYVDGSLIHTTDSIIADGYDPNFGLFFGANPWLNNLPYADFNGKLTGFKVLNETMTASEVSTEYSTTAPT